MAAGGLLLATQDLAEDGNPAAMEAESGKGGRHGDCHAEGCSGRPGSSPAAAADSRQHSEEPGEDNNTRLTPEPGSEPEPAGRVPSHVAGDAQEEEGEGGDADFEDEECPPGSRYRFYILNPEDAVAASSGGTPAGDARGGEGSSEGVGRLKERYHFVVIGEGTAADAAMESILRMRPEAEILCLSDETPSPADDNDTHTGNYDSDFRLLRSDLAASFNQWRRQFTFRVEGFVDGGGGITGGEEGRGSAYGLSRGNEIRYHTYQPHDLVIEPERRCVRLLLDGIEVYYDKCLIANSGKPRDDLLGGARKLPTSRARDSGKLLSGSAPEAERDGRQGGTQAETEGRGPRTRDDETNAPRTPAGGRDSRSGGVSDRGRVNRLLSLQDFVSLELLTGDPSVKHVTVLGGGFLGCEVALALSERGRATGILVTQVYPERTPMEHVLPDYLAEHMQNELSRAGVTALTDTCLENLRYNAETKRLEADAHHGSGNVDVGSTLLESDYVVVASAHIEPRVDVASDSGLEIDKNNGGIVVNGLFEAVNGIYAAGGAASFFDPAIGRRRASSHDHCVNSGLSAGYNMAASLTSAQNDHELAQRPSASTSTSTSTPSSLPKGPPSPPHPRLYDHVPFWRSSLSNLAGCGVVMEGLGEVDPSLRTMGVWLNNPEDSREASYKRGVVYYMRDDKVAGILLLNLSQQLERARDVIRLQPRIRTVAQLKRLIDIDTNVESSVTQGGTRGLLRVVDTPGGSSLLGEP